MFAALIPLLGGILDKIIPDAGQAAQAKLALMQMIQNGQLAQLTAQADVIKAEASSQFPLTAQWRPILMLVFTGIIFNNYFLAPYLQAMFGWHVTLELPPQMWDLLKLGIGGYIVGRSVEKSVSVYRQKAASSTTTPNISNGG